MLVIRKVGYNFILPNIFTLPFMDSHDNLIKTRVRQQIVVDMNHENGHNFLNNYPIFNL